MLGSKDRMENERANNVDDPKSTYHGEQTKPHQKNEKHQSQCSLL